MIRNYINFTGRFDFSDPEGPRFAWSASSVSARFFGTAVSVKLRSSGVNYFAVLIDGQVIKPLLCLDTNIERYDLVSGLDLGPHEVKLVKRTEFYLGTTQFLGFEFIDGKQMEPFPILKRRIEFIGDSITCGFGNEGPDQDTEYDPKYDNAHLSYGMLTSINLDAEPILIGYSGFGVIRDYEGNKANTVPSRYDLIIPESTDKWNFGSWIPDIVIINLGTNDFSFGYIPDRAEFRSEYTAFIRRIHANYPEAEIICSVGPLMDGESLVIARDYIKNSIVGYLKQEYPFVHFLEFEQQKEEDGYGISRHPSLKTHQSMARKLSCEIKKLMNW